MMDPVHKTLVGIVVLLALIAVAIGEARAQPSSALVVTVCGTPLTTYSAGQNRQLTQDTNGKACVNATVSASVTVAPLTSTNLSSTIAVTNTFQSIQASTAGRNGCLIQNNSQANEMWVFFGAIGSATKATAFGLPPGTATTPGGSIACAVGGLGVLTDQVSITGTATDAFVANFQ